MNMPLHVKFGGFVEVLGCDLPTPTVRVGEVWRAQIYYRVLGRTSHPHTFQVTFVPDDGGETWEKLSLPPSPCTGTTRPRSGCPGNILRDDVPLRVEHEVRATGYTVRLRVRNEHTERVVPPSTERAPRTIRPRPRRRAPLSVPALRHGLCMRAGPSCARRSSTRRAGWACASPSRALAMPPRPPPRRRPRRPRRPPSSAAASGRPARLGALRLGIGSTAANPSGSRPRWRSGSSSPCCRWRRWPAWSPPSSRRGGGRPWRRPCSSRSPGRRGTWWPAARPRGGLERGEGRRGRGVMFAWLASSGIHSIFDGIER